MQNLISRKDAAEILGISVKTLDLNKEFQWIAAQLDQIVEENFL